MSDLFEIDKTEEDHSDDMEKEPEEEPWMDAVPTLPEKSIFSGIDNNSLDVDVEKKYSNFLDEGAIEETSLHVHELKDEKVDLLKAFREEEVIESEGIGSLNEVRNAERFSKEESIKNAAKKVQRKLFKQLNQRNAKRRKRYQEMSEMARVHFRSYEDRLKLSLEKKHASLEPVRNEIDVHKRQWKLKWKKEPNQLDLRFCQIRGVGDKLKKGEYVMLVSLYDRIGGVPIKHEKHEIRLRRASEPIYHNGTFKDCNLIFDQLFRMTCTSEKELNYQMVLVFELLFLKIGRAENSKVVNDIVGWGVFPLVDNNKCMIKGCFKCPLIKGEFDRSVDKFSTIEKILKKNLDHWLGNFYFEANHGDVDVKIAPPEEYFLEIIHESDDEEEEEDDDDDDDDDRGSSNILKNNSILSPGTATEDDGPSLEERLILREPNNNNELEEEIKIENEGSLDMEGDEFKDGVDSIDKIFKEEFEQFENEEESTEMIWDSDKLSKRRGEFFMRERDEDSSGGELDEEEEFIENQESLIEEDERKKKERMLELLLGKKFEERGIGLNIETGQEIKQKTEHIDILTADNPRIWFGKPQFGYVKEKDDWNEDHEVLLNDGKGNMTNRSSSRSSGHLSARSSFRGGSFRIERKGGNKRDSKGRTREKMILKKGKFVSEHEIEEEKRKALIGIGEKDDDLTSEKGEFEPSPFSSKAKRKRKRENRRLRKLSNLSDMSGDFLSPRSNRSRSNSRNRYLGDDDEKAIEYPYDYDDNEFFYDPSYFSVTRDRRSGEKDERDVEKMSRSFFERSFAIVGNTKTELVLYKQSVKRKKFSWKKQAIYLEKLHFLLSTTLSDLGFEDWRKWEFYFMLMFSLFVFLVRSYPHYLGQWLWLSLFEVPFQTPIMYGVYMRFSYSTAFQSTLFNFTYTAIGNSFNIFLSCFVLLLTYISQYLFKNLPLLFYRFILIYVFSIIFDSIIFLVLDLCVALIKDPNDNPYGDGYVLGDYYGNTEGSSIPGVLLTVGVFISLILIQIFVFYLYITRIHMNRRVLDLYKRLHFPERRFYSPHDLEVGKKRLQEIVEEAKEWVGENGRTKKIETTEILLNVRDCNLLRRIEDVLSSKNWPHDYIQKCIEKESPYYDQGRSVIIPKQLLEDIRTPAVFVKNSSIGKQFIVRNAENLANALYFDEMKHTNIGERKRQLFNLFKKYRLVTPSMLERMKKNKMVTCLLTNQCLIYSDVDFINEREMELSVPSLRKVKSELNYNLVHWIQKNIFSAFKKKLHQKFKYGKTIAPMNTSLVEVERLERRRERDLIRKRKEDFERTSTLQAIQHNENNNKRDNKKNDLFAHHIVIYLRDKGRLSVRRNFVQTPKGKICEIFGRKKIQLSVSNISLPNSTEYWIDRAFDKTRIEENERKRKRGKRRRIKRKFQDVLTKLRFTKLLNQAGMKKKNERIAPSSSSAESLSKKSSSTNNNMKEEKNE